MAAHLGALTGMRDRLGPGAGARVLQVAAPFTLITVGEQELSSSLTGILVATAPIFTFLLAYALEGEERASALSPDRAWRSASAAWRCCWAWTRRAEPRRSPAG